MPGSWRLVRLRAVVTANSDNAFLRARASQLVGAALVADNIRVPSNPLSRSKRRAGLLGAAFVLGFGVVWVLITGRFTGATDAYPHGRTATGTVVSTTVETTPDGSTACSALVGYTVSGQQFRTLTGYSSSSLCGSAGTHVPVSYLPAQPAAGRPMFRSDRLVLTLVRWIGYAVVVLGVLMLVRRLVELVVGLGMMWSGRRQLARTTPAPVPTDELMSALRHAWSPPGRRIPALTTLGVRPVVTRSTRSPGRQPATTSAGWYPDPDAGGGLRWWNGRAWTVHRRAADRPPG